MLFKISFEIFRLIGKVIKILKLLYLFVEILFHRYSVLNAGIMTKFFIIQYLFKFNC